MLSKFKTTAPPTPTNDLRALDEEIAAVRKRGALAVAEVARLRGPLFLVTCGRRRLLGARHVERVWRTPSVFRLRLLIDTDVWG
jgi:hypothetical protein